MKKRLILLFICLILIVATLTVSSCNCSSLSATIDDLKNVDPFSISSLKSENPEETQPNTVSPQAEAIVPTIPSSTEYEYIKSAHDWIITNTSYDTTQPISSIPNTSFSSEGVFTYNLAVCQGYALAFEELMDAKGIECKVVYGDAGGVSHAWNIVKLDGSWYHVDTTWDDPLISGVNGIGTSNLSYDYFLMPDSVIIQTHNIAYVIDNNYTRDQESSPTCNSTTYVFYPKSYGVQVAITLYTINDMPQKYYESLQNGNSSVTFFFPESESYSDTIITDLQNYVASKDGSCSGFSINVGESTFVGYKYLTLIPSS